MKKSAILSALIFVFCSAWAQNKNDIAKYTSQKLPYGFIENKGQIHDQNYKANSAVKYLLCLGNGMNIQLKANSFSYDTYKADVKEKNATIETDKMTPEKEILFNFHRVDIELVGANVNPQIIAEEPSPDYLNYYNAVTPEHGATNVRHYKKITYKDIYPGIDMIFVARQGKEKPVEYTFVVNPGADAGQIKMHYTGANQTLLDENKIKVDVAHGRFTESIPASWINETNDKINITYNKIDEDVYGFDIPSYNKSQTLFIDPDPDLEWGTYYGGSTDDVGYGISCDVNGDIVITGATSSTAGIATAGAYQATCVAVDAFVVKFSSNGVRQWGTYFGGSGCDEGYGITCDENRNIFITGGTFSTDGIATAACHQATYAGQGTFYGDAFVAKFNYSGIRQWGTYYGGSDDDVGYGITCDDKERNVYITGNTKSASGIATPAAHQTVLGGGSCWGDAFIVKFNTDGVRQWGTYYGGDDSDEGRGIVCDEDGNLFVTGSTDSYNAISTSGAHQTTHGGVVDAFVAKFSTNGVQLWGTYYGGNSGDYGWDVSYDISGNVFITGFTASTDAIASAGAYQTAYGGGDYDVFIVKFNISGVRQWGTYYGDSDNDKGNGIAYDGFGNIYITGMTKSTAGMASAGAFQTTYGGTGINFGDAFVAKFNSSGIRQWGTYYGGSEAEYGHGVSCDDHGYVFVVGFTTSTAGIATGGSHQDTYGGGLYDAFIAKFSSTGSGISDNLFPDQALTVYPNPVSDELIIEAKGNKETINFEIYNAAGQLVFKGKMFDKITVPTASFAGGTYIIKLENGNSFEFGKVITK
ncbi:MAG TPA: SBBP repeat-containing protein [Bacteroidales bacterium]|nr:SBBP repeat-containing protein [Bacteroidales bacterium]